MGFIFGIEDGWFRHDRSGFLQWSTLGRERYAAGDSATYTEAESPRRASGPGACFAAQVQTLDVVLDNNGG
jgi:hypothetical protein